MDKTLFLKADKRSYQGHPVFQGVRISKLTTKEETPSIWVSILEVAPGAEISLHNHEASLDSIYVLGGKGSAYINGEWRGIREGDYLSVPEKVEHGIRNNGQAPLKLLAAHVPPLF